MYQTPGLHFEKGGIQHNSQEYVAGINMKPCFTSLMIPLQKGGAGKFPPPPTPNKKEALRETRMYYMRVYMVVSNASVVLL